MNKTILVVAQFEGVREIINDNLKKKGFNVLNAKNKKQSDDHLDGRFIDLLICDCDSTEEDSYTIIKELRENDYYEFTPVIVISTKLKKDNLEKIKQLKIGGWIQKPFDVNEFNFLVSQYTK